MKSQWYELKPKAIELRQKGFSIRDIEDKLKVPKSTLSHWLRVIKLSADQKARLRNEWLIALERARQKAVLWHNAQKARRVAEAEKEALSTFKKINSLDKITQH